MVGKIALLYSFALCLCLASAQSQEGKNLALFNVVTFPNDNCDSDNNKNGTCYTSEECASKGGDSQGSCAEGFGVCCVFELDCDETSSENNTYLTKSGTAATTCKYKICPCQENICRIRFDFKKHVLTNPVSGTSTTLAATDVVANQQSLGQCADDSFSISGGNGGTPVICGVNTGYHMIVDATKDCHMVNFNIGGSTTTTREWDIVVSQYECGEDDMTSGGPPGCLQYHTSLTGTIQSFNFPTAAAIAETTQHLADQEYNICIRRGANRCAICYVPTDGIAMNAGNMGTFGLSISPNNDATKSSVNEACLTDYVYIPGTNALAAKGVPTTSQANKFCGRWFATAADATAHASSCTRALPFMVGVHFDNTEVATAGGAANKADVNELNGVPSGTIGFKLNYEQLAC